MAENVIIENDIIKVILTPENGAGMLGMYAKKDGKELPIMPDARDESHELTWCNWMMIPYSNRVENGKFSWEGKDYELKNGDIHSIHGDTRTRPWSVEDNTGTYIRCDFKSSDHADFNWPWPIEARGEYEVMNNVFSMRMMLWNRGETSMPAGFGYHPYFSRQLTEKEEQAIVTVNFHGIYPDAVTPCIPSGPAEPPAPELDFSAGKAITTEQFFDFCSCGYDGKGTIKWPESGVRLTFDCSPTLSHLVCYNPLDYCYFAIEPVSNANNGVNLYADGEPTAGTVSLAPGECLEARMDMKIDFI
ncbi:MAG: hypothetical protein JXR97_14425 [Planctomycetes bacterium]|nr:hypothetical protein [Planctomycetota bacterium]